uniref:Uncharacterized protein n=1 Tax=Meloidogyne incognita TaxID=6306 RepID=A0A914LNP9_MELIC
MFIFLGIFPNPSPFMGYIKPRISPPKHSSQLLYSTLRANIFPFNIPIQHSCSTLQFQLSTFQFSISIFRGKVNPPRGSLTVLLLLFDCVGTTNTVWCHDRSFFSKTNLLGSPTPDRRGSLAGRCQMWSSVISIHLKADRSSLSKTFLASFSKIWPQNDNQSKASQWVIRIHNIFPFFVFQLDQRPLLPPVYKELSK